MEILHELKLNPNEESEMVSVHFEKIIYPEKHMCVTYLKQFELLKKVKQYDNQKIKHSFKLKFKKKGALIDFRIVNINFGIYILYRIFTIRRHSDKIKKKYLKVLKNLKPKFRKKLIKIESDSENSLSFK